MFGITAAVLRTKELLSAISARPGKGNHAVEATADVVRAQATSQTDCMTFAETEALTRRLRDPTRSQRPGVWAIGVNGRRNIDDLFI
jgi:hypothetical protein